MGQQQIEQEPAANELSRDDLLEILLRYNEATERLRVSHESLQGKVAGLTAELEHKNRELQRRERLAVLGEMAAGVAHEIRNPLGAISLCADLLADDLAGRAEPLGILSRLQNGVRILNRIVEDMLLFMRDLHIDARPHCLNDLVESALGFAALEIEHSGLRVVVSEWELMAEVQVDGLLIVRSLLNLMLNAAQAAEGRGEASLRIAAAQGAPQQCFAMMLEDTCGGIDEEDLDKIFDPFFTRREQGTGLGLAIVHRAIEAHGGHITANNNQVGGTTFTLTLPLAGAGGSGVRLCRSGRAALEDHME